MSEAIVEKTTPKKVAAAKNAPTKTVAKKAAKKAAGKLASVETRMVRVLKDFKEHPKALPKKRAALIAKVANLMGKPADGPEVQGVIDRIQPAAPALASDLDER